MRLSVSWEGIPMSDSTATRDEQLGRSIRYAARLACLLAVTPHHPTLLELLRDLVVDAEHAWLLADETDHLEGRP
jgi:hypothetical protein